MNTQQQQTSSSSKKQSSSPQQTGKTNSFPSTPNSRKPNQSQGRRQQQAGGQNSNKKRNSPSYSNQMEFLSFQPALQDCFQTPPQSQYDNKRRASPRGGNNGNVVSQSAKYSSQVNGYNNSLSPIKLSSPAIAPIIRQGNNQQQQSARRQRGSPLALFKHTPFAGAKYLELPSTKDLPLPPAWLLTDGVAAPTSSNEGSLSSSPTSMIEPPSPTTEAAMKVAKENGFDGRVRIHPLQLIAAVSSC